VPLIAPDNRPVILLAEDDPVTRTIMTRFLSRADYQVEAVSNGVEALDKMRARYYSILVTDWEMPEMDGLALCKAVRGMALEGYVYMLLMTARDAKEHIIEGLEAGADDYLIKPVHEPELLARLNSGRRILSLEYSLKTSADRNRTLIENTSAVPWELVRNDCSIVYAAPQLSAIFGVTTSAAQTSASFLQLLHPHDREAFQHFIEHSSRGEVVATHFIDSRVTTDDDRLLQVRSFVVANPESGSSRTVCGLSIDITEQRRMERELMQSQKLDSIGQLAAGIAHEINTPTQFIGDNIRFAKESVAELLNVIEAVAALNASSRSMIPAEEVASLIDALDLDYLKAEIPSAIDQSLEGVERIAEIVAAMKEFSHPALECTPHDLNRSIASTITVAGSEWKYVADLQTDFDLELPPVPVMPGAFNQVILNIIINAAHAIAEATPKVKGTITVSTRRFPNVVEIRIQDSGGGIPEGIRHRIFDPFFTTKPVGKGTGQGLAIAHDVIVTKHRGTLSVECDPGKGTAFIIRLPLSTADHWPKLLPDDKPARALQDGHAIP
jgi:two-component system, NtrC family, sensor kinase